jgi:hypothetical protein
VNHYCTYFDRGFLIQGLAMARSLVARDPDSAVWVLALDAATETVLRAVGGGWIRVVSLADFERGDRALAGAKAGRSRMEYYFTLSPCWPRWLLAHRPEIDRITYVDADLWFFSDPAPVFAAMDAARASVAITSHDFAPWLGHYLQHGRFNVGVLSFRRDPAGLACLDDWRERCLAWCHDRVEDGRYADQGYLDAWPARFGDAVLVLAHPGVNLAPWNWHRHRLSDPDRAGTGGAVAAGRPGTADAPQVDGRPLICFHFARFRPLLGTTIWQSGQLDYGVMPWRWRQRIYGPYLRALLAVRAELVARWPDGDFPRRGLRTGRGFWRSLALRVVFGSDWVWLGGRWWGGRFGLGRWSGRTLAFARRLRRGFSARGPA